ncbi:MAG: hypothetical protein A2569_02880 [Candidatus Vogelbacteria bacterium RIFOXYD1_FULL_51_18]|uniref:Uncharacterized protein n=1 Tax=Candidatus Vogelbacteria bacterium RIFOXYD1_FULL_51_18 TaxID=1802440 RepID=A0A1G2QK42_9BACT|nr:MAG: hypothetical protein UY80_C0014G0003 [Parcubacteria group bacterium GW2011_GWB1_53_43]KKW38380.1 MAG: hypothetical protein UY88_C0012G0010 [Parcubacteria group bacterium GW2011_GWA1_54_88]OHA60362.1 MAG: hypothetical protein A2569_02880 [Candidatus Vogelbacteria bacterium RIFOXYD1_FULL_51_18]
MIFVKRGVDMTDMTGKETRIVSAINEPSFSKDMEEEIKLRAFIILRALDEMDEELQNRADLHATLNPNTSMPPS